MLKVKISIELERQLRAALTQEEIVEGMFAVLNAIDEARLEQEAARRRARETGMDYPTIVREFRRHLGDGLAIPPAPDAIYVRDIVAKAKRQGLNEQYIEQLCNAVLAKYPRPPYRLDWMVRRATDLLHTVHGDEPAGEGQVPGGMARVVTGRPRGD